MVDLLEGRGQSAVVAVKGDAFKRLDDRHFALNPLDPGHCTRLFTELNAGGVKAIPQVLHMWAIDERIAEEESLSDLEAGQQRMCASVLQVIQMITAPGFASPPRLAIFTRNAQRVCPGDSVAGVAQGTLWGLGRVIAMEHPELRCVRIDLDGTRDGGGLETLMDELAGLDRQESQLALRNGRRYVLRLTPSPAGLMQATPSTPLFAAEGGYLITGGLAGLGIAVAQWMAARGAGYLVLMGRSAPSDDSRKIIVDMENKGAHITIFQGDVADRESLEAIFDRMAAEGKPLRGIVHCAGTLDDGILLQQTWDRFRRAMRAKVYGAWNLHCLTRNRDLDFFVLFSSGAAFLGSSGQGNHASANAFMDALAHFRKAAGQPALTINWGAWSRIGAANREGLAQRIQTKGLGLIPPSDGLSVLGHLLQADSVQVGVLPIQWPELFGAVGDGIDRRVFAEFEALAKLTDAHKDKVPALFLEQLGRSTPGRRGNLMLETLQKEVCRCLGIDSRQTLDTRQPLTELGLDSLMAVELRNFISQLVQAPLPATLLFNYPSLGELVQYLLHDVLAARLEQDRHEPVEMNADQDKDNQNSLDDFSEEEMENLLREKLMNL
jgi:myxalamid-type polyketide synthase MxaE and MxaD